MTFITFSKKPRECLPVYFSNSAGYEEWSGKKAADLTTVEFETLLDFCRREGFRQGYNDARARQLSQRESGIFHPDLLEGVPAGEWNANYWDGVNEYLLEAGLQLDQLKLVEQS